MTFSLPQWPDVDLWWINLERTSLGFDAARAVLDASEDARIAGFRSEGLQTSFVLRRAARRLVLARYLGCAARDVGFATAQHGKPSVLGSALQFSASHSGSHAVIAVASRQVGVDVEAIKPLDDLDALARTICTPKEQAQLAALDDPARLFFRFWVQKEAAVKLSGAGLTSDLRSVTVGPDGRFDGGVIALVDAPDGYAAALASDSEPRARVRDFEGEILKP